MESPDQQQAIAMARRVIGNCLAGRVRQINRVVTAHYDRQLDAIGVTANQLTILSAIALLQPVSQTDLIPYLLMEPSTLSRNTQRMLKNQWLATIPGEDRRSHLFVVAPEGVRVLAEVEPYWEAAHEWAEKALGKADAIREIAHAINPKVPL